MKCENCKYWKREQDEEFSDAGQVRGPTKRNPDYKLEDPDSPLNITIDPYGSWGECIKGAGKGGNPLTETLVFAKDASSYNASLSTRYDFGCVLYESKN